jgi:predicted ATPase
VGREEVLARLGEVLDGGARLVTILGSPGIGKTRLAQRLLELRGPEYTASGGAWFCDLSAVTDAAGLCHAVAALWPSLEAGHIADDDMASRVAEHLGEHLGQMGKLLLVLDNFEQLSEHARIVHDWCQASPEMRVVVTSRERLLVEGEAVVEVPPLACPGKGDSHEDVLACEAVRLLIARAREAGGELGNDPDVLGALARELDGIPLAIELAAARSRVLGASELLARLQHRFELLTRGARTAGGRHATLATAIDWSWNLLSLPEQSVLSACSVFLGGFTAEAAERIVPASQDLGVVEGLGALRDKSLLHVSGDDGRLGLLVSVREYVADKLARLGPAAARALRWRHARHYAAQTRPFNEARTLQGTVPDAPLRVRLTRDRENIVAALAFVRREPIAGAADAEVLAELAVAATLLEAAPMDSSLAALAAALEATTDPALRVRILLARRGLLNAAGLQGEARADLEAVLAIADLPRGIRAFALTMHGVQLRYAGDAERAWVSHEQAVRALEGLDLPRLAALNLACMGRLGCDFGDEQRARDYNGRAARVAREIGDGWLEGLSLGNLAQLEQELGHFEASLALLEQALAHFRRASEPQYVAVYTAALGDLYFEWGNAAETRRSYEIAAQFLHGWLQHRGTTQLYASWAAFEATQGDGATAKAYLDRAHRSAGVSENIPARAFLKLAEAVVDLCRLRREGASAEVAALEAERWRGRLRKLEAGGGLTATSIDVRFALRILRRVLGDAAAPTALAERVVVARRGGSFSLGDGRKVDLGRRGALRRILGALATQRSVAPGVPLDPDTLLAAGWPGQRLLADAASTRLRVAIATLRRLGLRDALLTRDGGYLLDRSVQVDKDG